MSLTAAMRAVAAMVFGTDLTVDVGADQPLQHPYGAANAGVHAVIEHRVVDAGRKIVASHCIPILRPVDVFGDLHRHAADVGGCRRRLPVGARVVDGDAPIGGAAGIGRMIGVAAFMHEHASERLVVRRCCHCQSSCCECLQPGCPPRRKRRPAPTNDRAERQSRPQAACRVRVSSPRRGAPATNRGGIGQ